MDFSEQATVVGEVAAPLSAPEFSDGARARQRPTYPAVVADLLDRLAGQLGARMRDVTAISVTATSGTVVGVNHSGDPAGPALLYSDRSAVDLLERIDQFDHAGRPTDSLARMAEIYREFQPAKIVTSADTVTAFLTGSTDLPSDTSHTLKAGVDTATNQWPEETLAALGLPDQAIPALVSPGTVLGSLDATAAQRWNMSPEVLIVAGMTDGCTSQIATGALAVGDTVGVLGTTLVLKGSAAVDIREPRLGVYSHRSPDGTFLPGGASNIGGASLPIEANAERLVEMTSAVVAGGLSAEVVYPLPRPGERFPFYHPTATPLGMDTWASPEESFPAVVQAIAMVERLGRETLGRLGVPLQHHVVSGGAASSEPMNRLRATLVGQPVVVPEFFDSAVGAAILAGATAAGSELADFSARHGAKGTTADPLEGQQQEAEQVYGAFLDMLRAAGYLGD